MGFFLGWATSVFGRFILMKFNFSWIIWREKNGFDGMKWIRVFFFWESWAGKTWKNGKRFNKWMVEEKVMLDGALESFFCLIWSIFGIRSVDSIQKKIYRDRIPLLERFLHKLPQKIDKNGLRISIRSCSKHCKE